MSMLRLKSTTKNYQKRPSNAVATSVLLHGMLGIFLLVFGYSGTQDRRSPFESRFSASVIFKDLKSAASIQKIDHAAPLASVSNVKRVRLARNQQKKRIPRPSNEPKHAHNHVPHLSSTSDSQAAVLSTNADAIIKSESGASNQNLKQNGPSSLAHEQNAFRPSPLLVNGSDVRIPYPEKARLLMVEGIVRLRLTVSETGRVIDAEILSGPAFGLRTAALMVARKLFFLPATDAEGNAMIAHVDHEVVFKLNKPIT